MIKAILRFLSAYFLVTLAVSAAPFQNGSFEEDDDLWNDGVVGSSENKDHLIAAEQDLTGWTFDIVSFTGNNPGLDWVQLRSGVTAHQGSYYLENAGTVDNGLGGVIIRVHQTFDTVAGRKYKLTYYLQGRSVSGSASDREIEWTVRNANSSGTLLLNKTDTPSGNDIWTEYTLEFTATSGTTYLSFENTVEAVAGTLIDNLSLEALPSFFIDNHATYPDDPSSLNLKAVPGQVMIFDTGLRNIGSSPDNGSVDLVISVNSNIAFELNSGTFEDGRQPISGATGNVAVNYSTTGNSTLTCCSGLEIDYSNTGPSGPWGYTPSTDFTLNSENYDNDVRAIRISPSGTFADGTSSQTGFRFYYKGAIK